MIDLKHLDILRPHGRSAITAPEEMVVWRSQEVAEYNATVPEVGNAALKHQVVPCITM